MTGRIMDLKRYAIHDGDGIRTTVFFKGCPLKCVWCHNPEGIGFGSQLAFYANKCIGCGTCGQICPVGAHSFENGHTFRRDLCTACGRCAEECPTEALSLFGRQMTVEQLLPLLLEDRIFYQTSGGGVTLSGGECLCQAEFCRELLSRLKAEGIDTAVDTCGMVPRSALDCVLPFTDIFLYDVKAANEDVHIRCTGVSNKLILDNLRYLDERGAQLEIRIPLIPGWNGDEIHGICGLLGPLKHLKKVRVLPYNNLAGSKYVALGMPNTMPRVAPPTAEVLDEAIAVMRSHGLPVAGRDD